MDGYTLRLQRMDRKIKLFICITLYNEDQDTLRKTLMGVADVSTLVTPNAAGCQQRILLPLPHGLPALGWYSRLFCLEASCRHNLNMPSLSLQNLEVVYSQYLEKDGRRGLDWTEVAVCLIQDGISNADETVLAASTVQVPLGLAMQWLSVAL